MINLQDTLAKKPKNVTLLEKTPKNKEMRIAFTKMHGAGNDYIYVNTMNFPLAQPELCSKVWSAPHTGIGSDGLVLIESSDKADFKMRIFNADGSEAMMCGNASRCIGKYVYEQGLTQKTEVSLETLSGIKILKLHIHDGKVESVTVDMGEPSNIRDINLGEDLPHAQGVALSMGNPHLVLFTTDAEKEDLLQWGPRYEHHPLFPNRTNTEFAQITGENAIRMRVWERGSGITLACGTGACATAVAAASRGFCGRDVSIVMDGGTLHIHWDEEDNHVYMTGPATTVFHGEIEWNED